MSKKNQIQGQKKVADANAVVTKGMKVDGTVKSKGEQSLVISYAVNGTTCSGVLHVSQIGAFSREKRDQIFAGIKEKQELKGLEVIEVVAPSGDRKFTSVRLSALSVLKTGAEEQRKAAEANRAAKLEQRKQTTASLNGKVVLAKVKELGVTAKTELKESHTFGAFLVTDAGGQKISGLLHVSRMRNDGGDKVERLKAAQTSGAEFEVVLNVNDDGRVSFSEVDVNAARQREKQAEQVARQAADREQKLEQIRSSLAAGTAEQTPFLAKVKVNRLAQNDGIDADYAGITVKVSSEALAIPAANLKGVNHTVKLVALSEENGVVVAKRYQKAS